MAAPLIVPDTWPRNSSRELHATYDDNTAVPTVPLSTGSVTVIVRDVNGTQIGSTFNGTHLGNGEWEINIAALNQLAGALGEFTLTATKGADADNYAWWVKFVDPHPPLTP